jgi:hypothetical protein
MITGNGTTRHHFKKKKKRLIYIGEWGKKKEVTVREAALSCVELKQA